MFSEANFEFGAYTPPMFPQLFLKKHPSYHFSAFARTDTRFYMYAVLELDGPAESAALIIVASINSCSQQCSFVAWRHSKVETRTWQALVAHKANVLSKEIGGLGRELDTTEDHLVR